MTQDINSRFGRMELLAGNEMMRRMAAMRVALFGLGGVGSWCAEALVRAGVGHITIVDSDDVALSNCNRQLPALDSTVGRPKAEVLRERLLDINPACCVEARVEAFTPENASSFDLGAYDYVVDAARRACCSMPPLRAHARCRAWGLRSRCTPARLQWPSSVVCRAVRWRGLCARCCAVPASGRRRR